MKLTLGMSPCPNDTFMISAIAEGRLTVPDVEFDIRIHDVEQLNHRVIGGQLDIAKISCATYACVENDYALLETGAALANGYGPLVLSSRPLRWQELASAHVATPGEHTTAALLLELWGPRSMRVSHARFDEIIPRLLAREFDAGVVIHESRFTYQASGLHLIEDLGAWWKRDTGLPVPLGCFVMRRDLHAWFGPVFEGLMWRSIALATGQQTVNAYVRANAQEPADDALRQHIGAFVNQHARHLGSAGRDAIRLLAARGRRCRDEFHDVRQY